MTDPHAEAVPGGGYFVATDGLAVHAEATAASPIIGRLALRQKVVRGETVQGFAHVTASSGALRGWVDGAELLTYRPPPSPSPSPIARQADRPAPATLPSPVPTRPVPIQAPSTAPEPPEIPAALDSPPAAATPAATRIAEQEAPTSPEPPLQAPAAKPEPEMLNPF